MESAASGPWNIWRWAEARCSQAHDLFDRLLSYGSDVGLFSEETDPEYGDALGNFPQAFTHVGLISAALTLEEKERGEPHPAEETGANTKIAGREARV